MASPITSIIGRRLLGLSRCRFVQDERGATAVEFGILALPFFMIVGAILETSILFLSGQVLEGAVQDVSRLIRTGEARTLGITSAETFKTRVCDRLFNLFADCDALHVEVSVVTNFSNATISPPVDPDCENDCDWTRSEGFDAGDGSDIVVVQVYYRYPIVVGLGGYNLDDGTRLLSGAAILRNEPFT